MVKISKDIKELLDRRPKTVTTSRLVYKLVIFLALVGLLAIIVGATTTCRSKPATEPAPLPDIELGR